MGTGTLTLTGVSTYSGDTTVSGGSLNIAADNNIGTGALVLQNGTTLGFNNSFTFSHPIALTGDPTFNVTTDDSVTISSVIADGAQGGNLVMTGGGKLIFTGANTYTTHQLDRLTDQRALGNAAIASIQAITSAPRVSFIQ